MQRSTLVVDDDETRRRALVHAFSRRGLRYLDVADAFGAMAALGRADFGAVVAAEGRRTLSLRGLCQLARRRHPGVAIFVLHRDGSDPDQIPGILGTPVDVVSGALGADQIARIVEDRLLGPPPEDTQVAAEFVDIPNTSDVMEVFDEDPTLKMPVAHLLPPSDVNSLQPDEATERMVRAPSQERRDTLEMPRPITGVTAVQALLEGLLDGGTGPALLMGVFAQELTGRLIVKDGPGAGTLYFYRGEPVWADDPLGDQGLHRRLVQKGKLAPNAKIEAVPAGQLLGALVRGGNLTGAAMHDFMRDVVRDAVLALANAQSGAYRFEEDKKFLDVAPLLKVNPFGLILESRRKSVTPAQLLTMSNEMERSFAIPGPGLATAQEKLAPFVRGAKLNGIIDGARRVSEVISAASLDPFMGTLVLLSLKDAQLISLADAPRVNEGGVTLNDALVELSNEEITIVDAEMPPIAAGSEEEAKAREEIFALYMKLKPLTVPRHVIGVGVEATLEDVDVAYGLRMKELDPARVPEGSAQQLLMSRIEELRKKVTSAYQALRLQLSASGSGVFNRAPGPRKNNPF